MPAAKRIYSVDEYVRLESDAAGRHEYRDGEIRLTARDGPDNNIIIATVTGELRNLLRGGQSRVYDVTLRYPIPPTVFCTYPEATVICGPRGVDPSDPPGQAV